MIHSNIHITEDLYSSSLIHFDNVNYQNKRIRSFSPLIVNQINSFLSQNNFKQSAEEFSSYDYLIENLPQNLKDRFPLIASYYSSIKPVSSFFDQIKKQLPLPIISASENQPYPIAVRYTDSKKIWLIERPPFKATITYKNVSARNQGNLNTVDIWMPWTAMLIISNPEESNYINYLFFNDSPITSLDDLAIPCFHMNMYDDGKMCLNASYIMLQQYLSQINSYNISDIYNFVLNDYMSGGWNTDLGLNVFDSFARYSPTFLNIRNTIYKGSDELGMKPSTTPTGRVSFKKYYKNYFTYFSSLTLDQVLSLVTSFKNELANNDVNQRRHHYSTYNKVISKYIVNRDNVVPFLLDTNNENYPLVSNQYRLFIHSSLIPIIEGDRNEEYYSFIEKIQLAAREKVAEINQENIKTMIEEPNYTVNYTLNNDSLFVDSDLSVHFIGPDFSFDNFFNTESTINA